MDIDAQIHNTGELVMGHAGNAPGNGPFMRITLRVVTDSILDASYETYQCPACHACGKAVCDLVRGKTIESAKNVRHDNVVELVGPLPQSRSACYGLAVLALSEALDRLSKATT